MSISVSVEMHSQLVIPFKLLTHVCIDQLFIMLQVPFPKVLFKLLSNTVIRTSKLQYPHGLFPTHPENFCIIENYLCWESDQMNSDNSGSIRISGSWQNSWMFIPYTLKDYLDFLIISFGIISSFYELITKLLL